MREVKEKNTTTFNTQVNGYKIGSCDFTFSYLCRQNDDGIGFLKKMEKIGEICRIMFFIAFI
jgi:hypothetical protein